MAIHGNRKKVLNLDRNPETGLSRCVGGGADGSAETL